MITLLLLRAAGIGAHSMLVTTEVTVVFFFEFVI